MRENNFKKLGVQSLKVEAEKLSSLLEKYKITDERERQRILESIEKAKKIKLEKGFFYEVGEGILIGVNKDGKLMVYIC
ncbi:MAG: hypothetical protein QW321_01295 [Candidatus Aenigmatarchaeota archaeon]